MSNFSVAAVFSNHMVLQRNKPISIFGYADLSTTVTVELKNKDGKTLSENTLTTFEEKWCIQLAPQTAQTDCKLFVSFAEKSHLDADGNDCASSGCEVFEDIAIGEVWIAGGQSNMEFELQNCTEGPDELSDLDGRTGSKNVRFYYTNKIAWKDENFYEEERNTCWQTWDSTGRGAWSAVGYFFAKKLARDLDCIVGIIGCNWGGTSASAWMRKEYLEKDADLNTYLSEYKEALYGKSIEQQINEYDDYEIENAKWQEEFSKLWQNDHNLSWAEAEKIIGKNPWPGPKSCKNPYRPTGLYDCMLSRILPYTVKGFLWYQGESDDHKPQMYYKLFSSLIENWRTDWKDEQLPFVFVQLPVHRYKADSDFKHWCLIREAQAKVHNNIKNAFMTCALDLGEFNDIHPKAKKVLGERMEQNALANVYKTIPSEKALSPTYAGSLVQENQIIIYFDNAAEGFSTRDDNLNLVHYREMEKAQGNEVPAAFTSFEIAGSDGVFYPAAYKFSREKGHLNQITLSSPMVKNPLFARYAWYNYGPVTIFGTNGLPVSPFRTNTFIK